jgi:hypothetical protein
MSKKQTEIQKQINKCLRDLNVLKDLIYYEHWDRFDVEWEQDQIESAVVALEKLKEGDPNE